MAERCRKPTPSGALVLDLAADIVARSGKDAAEVIRLQNAIRWQDSMFVPNNPRCVLATDGEEHFMACYHEDKWWNVHTDEEIDSVIIAWMELPEPPEA